MGFKETSEQEGKPFDNERAKSVDRRALGESVDARRQRAKSYRTKLETPRKGDETRAGLFPAAVVREQNRYIKRIAVPQ